MTSSLRPPGPPHTAELSWSNLVFIRNYIRDPIGTIGGRFATYGDLYYASIGSERFFVLRHPDHIQDVLLTRAADFHKLTQRDVSGLSLMLGNGLITADGDEWRRNRRMIQPAFRRQRIVSYSRTMTACAADLADTWQHGESRDVDNDMMRLTLRVVLQTLFSLDPQGRTADRVSDAMKRLRDSANPTILPLWLPMPGKYGAWRARQDMDRLVFDLIDGRRRAIDAGEEVPEDLLTTLLETVDEEDEHTKFSRQQLRDELITLYFTGHETTSNALVWAWYLLSQNAESEARLHDELDTVLAGRPPTVEDLDALPWLKAVLQETLRLYPSIPFMRRMAACDTRIGEYEIPADSKVLLWIYWTHYDPRWWPDPEVFRPERFLEDAERPRCAYVPFSVGKRQCIGHSFAMVEAQLVLATLAQRWRLEHAPGHRAVPDPRITLSPRYGMQMIPMKRS